jgi:predicted metal-binding transcription factor (methanogenesis marker protein 9)
VLEATADRQGISTDEYDALSKEMQNYFIRMADGTYELTIAAEEFAKKAKEARSAELERQALDQLKALFDDFTFATTMSENEISNIRIQ